MFSLKIALKRGLAHKGCHLSVPGNRTSRSAFNRFIRKVAHSFLRHAMPSVSARLSVDVWVQISFDTMQIY